jgi:endogenous inhibitor of DNA gyrase (YacG/DUF329 family)
MQQDADRQATGGTCPICRAATEALYRPFCSRRCADVDLARWLKGTYAVPAAQTDADEDGDDAQAAQGAANSPRGAYDEDE